jgi:predicted transcriptional regulator of viral defense system
VYVHEAAETLKDCSDHPETSGLKYARHMIVSTEMKRNEYKNMMRKLV